MVICSATVNPDDLVAGQASYSGGTYYLSLSDITSGTGCGTKTGSVPGGNPYYAEFIGERLDAESFTALATFNNVNFSEDEVCVPSCYGAYHYYAQGWYFLDNVANQGYKNINVGSVSGSSAPGTSTFEETWLTSSGT
ncbi:MAG TPA: hypothetical protein VJN71_00700 [Nitrososphaerales archaeon]|nr:hypothetical protein [Nitrososphaerales archaeon]